MALEPMAVVKRRVVERFERQYLTDLMDTHDGNVSKAAVAARKDRRDLGRLLKKHHLEPKSFARRSMSRTG